MMCHHLKFSSETSWVEFHSLQFPGPFEGIEQCKCMVRLRDFFFENALFGFVV